MDRRIIPALIVLLVVAVVGVGVYQAFKSARPATPTVAPSPTPKPVSLLDHVGDSDASVRLTTLGPIVAKEHHLEQTLTISLAHRSVDIARGYSGTAELSTGFDNNQPAFEDFLRALDAAGFTATLTPNAKSKLKIADTETGLCPNGRRLIYELVLSGQSVYRAWSTSCNDPTTFGGNSNMIQDLFTNQIPDYTKVVSAVRD